MRNIYLALLNFKIFVIDTDGLICQALLTGNFEAAVDVCFKDGRSSEGLLLAIAGGPDLFARTQKRYLDQTATTVARVSKLFVSVSVSIADCEVLFKVTIPTL